MSAAKHTPGEWVQRAEVGNSKYAEAVEAKSPRGKIITVARIGSGPLHREADARLIAAAPELVEALQMALNAHKGDWQNGSGWEQKARAAIAKATQ